MAYSSSSALTGGYVSLEGYAITYPGPQFPQVLTLAPLEGEIASELSHTNKTENAGETHYGQLLEVYVPIAFPGEAQVAGAFEIYQVFDPVAHQIATMRRAVILALGGGLLAFYLALLWIVHANSRIAHQANYDALTGLVNRRHFEELLARALDQARRTRQPLAVLFMDLDGFKDVNDTLGHHAGDALLVSVAGVLWQSLRPTDVLARLGGDEFAVLLPATGVAGAAASGERLRAALNAHVLILDGVPVSVSSSIGVALFPDHGASSAELVVAADMAMYQAKAYRDRVCVYTPDGAERAGVHDQQTWATRLRHALAHEGLVLYAQPVTRLQDGTMQYELLVRLQEEDGSLIAPGVFLPSAERSGLICVLDRWVLGRAIDLIAAAQQQGHDLRLAVNLSGKTLADPKTLPFIQAALQQTAIPPQCLILEITERTAVADLAQVQHFITTLQALGCGFALDDFGVGFSSFDYLKSLSADYVKIDGHLIQHLVHNPVHRHLVQAIVAAARGLGKKTVAEWVEDEPTLQLLRTYDLDFVQGFHLGPPQPLEDLLRSLHDTRTTAA